jgi:hypothetical protein
MKQQLLIVFFTIGLFAQVIAQESGGEIPTIDPQAMASDSLSSIRASFGVTQIGGETYAGLRLQPQFQFGKIGFGLDVPIQFNVNTKEFRDEEFQGGIEMIRMIRYVSIGRKKADAIYVRAGDLTGVSLGYGTLINNYSNSPSFEFRKFGLNFDLNFKKIFGLEALYSDIKGFNLLGVRPYVRPLYTTSIPIVKSLEFGVSYVVDKGKNADSTAYFIEKNGMKATAFDAGITFLNTSFVKLVGYGQFSELKKIKSDTLNDALAAYSLTYSAGKGTSVGLSANMNIASAFMLSARIERLWYKDHYLPQFFDAIYEINKDAKILGLTSAKGSQGIYGNLGLTLFSKFRITGALLMPDNISLESPALIRVGLEAAQLADKLTISGNYIKGNLQSLGDAFTFDESSLANFNMTYQLAKFFYVGVDYRWTFARLEDGSLKATNYLRPFFGLSIPLGGQSKSEELPR